MSNPTDNIKVPRWIIWLLEQLLFLFAIGGVVSFLVALFWLYTLTYDLSKLRMEVNELDKTVRKASIELRKQRQ